MKIPFVKPSLPQGTEAGLPVNYRAPCPLSVPWRKREGTNPYNAVLCFNTEEPLNEAHCLS